MQDQAQVVQFLRTVPLFAALEERQLQKLARRFTRRTYQPEEAIVSQGKLGIGLFIIETGRAEAIREHLDGNQTKVNEFGPTEFFGELSLLDDAPRTASVVASEPTVCLVLAQLDFNDVLHDDADIAVVMLRELARRFRRMMEQL